MTTQPFIEDYIFKFNNKLNEDYFEKRYYWYLKNK